MQGRNRTSGSAFGRRTFLLGAAAAGLTAACGGKGSSNGSSGKTSDQVLGMSFADGYSSPSVFAAGLEQRAPLVVFQATGTPVRDGAPESIEVDLYQSDTKIDHFTLTKHVDGISTPYYPLRFTPATPGDYVVKASWSSEPANR